MFSHPGDPMSVIEVRNFQRQAMRGWIQQVAQRRTAEAAAAAEARASAREAVAGGEAERSREQRLAEAWEAGRAQAALREKLGRMRAAAGRCEGSAGVDGAVGSAAAAEAGGDRQGAWGALRSWLVGTLGAGGARGQRAGGVMKAGSSGRTDWVGRGVGGPA
ncbi:hypothetical protein HYH03_009181 [Edaphochlamys debaryana]|uniref:Uncharacterized protein n=1 Tax=Edaphochlamys debaryana TaxID=47281 RepID=A0A835Y1T0_9CHLO|nr:hypothetical protein HYH03_009181 [Edaphochlamys debaryana]|eukprot:KAG2492516.1 hypothetical protein HYH03_009181 [Edaphochlamys debaryana]